MRVRIAAVGLVLVVCTGAALAVPTELRRSPAQPSPPEQSVRAVYAALSRANADYNRTRLRSVAEYDQLQFRLRDFRTGAIGEILATPSSDLATLPDGEIVYLAEQNGAMKSGGRRLQYSAEWAPGQYSDTVLNRQAVAVLLNAEPERFHDVGSYASYEVTVTFQGRSRTYRALALFHDLYGAAEHAGPDIWDTVVGFGGTIGALAQHLVDRPEWAPEPAAAFALTSGAAATPIPSTRTSLATTGLEAYDGWNYIYSPGCQPSVIVPVTVSNGNDHKPGFLHAANIRFSTQCCDSGGGVLCAVNYSGGLSESGQSTTNTGQYHVGAWVPNSQTGAAVIGQYNTTISCENTAGWGFNGCIAAYCTVQPRFKFGNPAIGNVEFDSTSVNLWGGAKPLKYNNCYIAKADDPATGDPCNRQVTSSPDSTTYDMGSPPCHSGGTGGTGTGSTGGGGGGGDPYVDVYVTPSVCVSVTVNGVSSGNCCGQSMAEVSQCIIAKGGS